RGDRRDDRWSTRASLVLRLPVEGGGGGQPLGGRGRAAREADRELVDVRAVRVPGLGGARRVEQAARVVRVRRGERGQRARINDPSPGADVVGGVGAEAGAGGERRRGLRAARDRE